MANSYQKRGAKLISKALGSEKFRVGEDKAEYSGQFVSAAFAASTSGQKPTTHDENKVSSSNLVLFTNVPISLGMNVTRVSSKETYQVTSASSGGAMYSYSLTKVAATRTIQDGEDE